MIKKLKNVIVVYMILDIIAQWYTAQWITVSSSAAFYNPFINVQIIIQIKKCQKVNLFLDLCNKIKKVIILIIWFLFHDNF